MCKGGTNTRVRVRIPEDLSCTGKSYLRTMKIDSCIAPIVKALQDGKVDMRGSCCGHGKGLGDIHLQDGRILLIANAQKWLVSRERYLLVLLLTGIWHKLKINFRIRLENIIYLLIK